MKFIIFICVSIFSLNVYSTPILITGQVSSKEQQIVTAPRLERWQIQVQWLMGEGEIAKKGDLIAVFDSGSTKSKIKQNEESLAAAKLQLKKKQTDFDQSVVEAEGKLAVAELELQRSSIEASVTSPEVSDYDKGQFKLTYERAMFAKIKYQQELNVKQKERESELAKQKIEIQRIEEELAFQLKTLERVSIRSTVNGPVSYVMHPWNDEKITAGTMVQQSMKVLVVNGQRDYEVQGWVHEIDINKLTLGDTAKLSLDAFPLQKFDGEITSIASQSEQKEEWSRGAYHLVKFTFTSKIPERMMPGMSVRVVIGSRSI